MAEENERTVTGMAKTITGVDYEGGKVVGVTISGIIDADNDQPTSAYFQRVRHGKWIEKEDMIASYLEQLNVVFYECSACKEPSSGISAYCKNCGAKMDGERI